MKSVLRLRDLGPRADIPRVEARGAAQPLAGSGVVMEPQRDNRATTIWRKNKIKYIHLLRRAPFRFDVVLFCDRLVWSSVTGRVSGFTVVGEGTNVISNLTFVAYA